ncbi:hypothetical protein IHQ71_11390 [Rhizobium sp. TH2]|uniref:calcium-binding protein n=1 Tax=Rhizobium sp. TH2 TaxID=2775403 RepID=UPI002157114C|nr:hypothetical protein [Rhizobium sp. TH2]UVC11121.1 hypothetical protein IHQ71_11390 [Rhizobium sp. TH2]
MSKKQGTKHDDILKGTNGNDVLKGLNGNDTLLGSGGNDTLDGALGDDELLGGNGNDLLLPGKGGYDAVDGGKGIDTVSFANFSSTAGVSITCYDPKIALGARDALGDSYIGVENYIGTGANDFFGFYNDILLSGYVYGGKGNDTIFAPGSVIRGDAGNDSLFGDASAAAVVDTFWLQLSKGEDFISNFETGVDIIRIKGREFGIGSLLNLDEFSIRPSDTNPAGEKAQFIFRQDTNVLYFDSDGTGSDAPVIIATFSTDIAFRDFEVV